MILPSNMSKPFHFHIANSFLPHNTLLVHGWLCYSSNLFMERAMFVTLDYFPDMDYKHNHISSSLLHGGQGIWSCTGDR